MAHPQSLLHSLELLFHVSPNSIAAKGSMPLEYVDLIHVRLMLGVETWLKFYQKLIFDQIRTLRRRGPGDI